MPPRYVLMGIVAMLAALVVYRMGSTGDAAHRIRDAYLKAEAPVLRPGSGLPEVEQFARDLRVINLIGAPDEVERTMNALIVAVEGNAVDRRAGWDTNAANDRVVFAKRDLVRALELAEPVPLGMNTLRVGARLYNPHPPNQLLWNVIEIYRIILGYAGCILNRKRGIQAREMHA